MRFTVSPGGSINGEAKVPGDKSISHRSIMLGSIANGVTEVSGFLQGADSLATLAAFREMGVSISNPENGRVRIEGVGKNGLRAPSNDIDLGNSGTSMRLLAGLLSGQNFGSTLIGDESLSKRPMNRVVHPLRTMGAELDSGEAGRPPIAIRPGNKLKGISYELPVASAQIKSCLLLAGLYAEGCTSITEPGPTRDHTERMLRSLGYAVETKVLESSNAELSAEGARSQITVIGDGELNGGDIKVPTDISSAAFFLVAASIVPGSELTLRDVGVNPTRTGILHILWDMGADITLSNERLWGAEPVADITVRSASLQGIAIPQRYVPLAIDEFPVVFIAALAASGTTVLTGARELRVKESDRIAVMADGISALGGAATATEDGMIIESSTLSGGRVDSHGDHRIAMAFSVAAMLATNDIEIENCTNVGTSFPGYAELAQSLGMDIRVR